MDRSWFWRRVAVFSTLGVCFALLFWLALFGKDTGLNRDIVSGAFMLLGIVITGYVFGAVWDDKIKGSERRSPDETRPLP
ncbi:hypothetical protein [Sinorhizobium sp. BG8]|uniref:hypothetical protein n=1 Tax=Sinorhizobium sp. BG8 TaxID=2613773 RepID=UPI00193D4D38|nr:hypothetical protein [Sinorhizobium sp. BG8]QRM55164.1 hypothetical protein F3Y30_11920 [Sinorhizobium sp. BG8]